MVWNLVVIPFLTNIIVLIIKFLISDLKMGVLEELPDDAGACPQCNKIATTKCTGCKEVVALTVLKSYLYL